MKDALTSRSPTGDPRLSLSASRRASCSISRAICSTGPVPSGDRLRLRLDVARRIGGVSGMCATGFAGFASVYERPAKFVRGRSSGVHTGSASGTQHDACHQCRSTTPAGGARFCTVCDELVHRRSSIPRNERAASSVSLVWTAFTWMSWRLRVVLKARRASCHRVDVSFAAAGFRRQDHAPNDCA